MVTCQKWLALLVSLQLLVVGILAIPSSRATEEGQDGDSASSAPLDSDTGDDRELKSDDDGYDFLSIDQLFLNNPQYRQLISDLQAHTFGSNWRRKRDVSENELPEALRSEASQSSPKPTTVASSTTTTSTTTVRSSTSTESLTSEVATNREITSASPSSDLPRTEALTSASTKSEATKPSTTSTASTTTASTSTPIRSGSTISTSASYGSSDRSSCS
uniref:Uncharacterized protein n=1 Tax=Anopheles atroparvus TaxID=41427 RepID=A0A182IY63_ANOAO